MLPILSFERVRERERERERDHGSIGERLERFYG